MSRKDYFSDNLIHMRDQIKKYQKPDNTDVNSTAAALPLTAVLTENPAPEQQQQPDAATPQTAPENVKTLPDETRSEHRHHHDHHDDEYDNGHKMFKSFKKRQEEYLLSRRDILHRLAETTGTLTENQNHYEILQDETTQLLELCNKMSVEIKALTIDELDNSTDIKALGEAFRKIEHCRLEFIRQHARYKKLSSNENHNVQTSTNERQHGGIMPEIDSMSFVQIIRLGFMFSLPAVAAFILGAIIIAIAIVAAMGGFIQG